MKLALSVIALIAWTVPQQISVLEMPITPSSNLQLENTSTYYSQHTTYSFSDKSVASNRKMDHRRTRTKPFQKNH